MDWFKRGCLVVAFLVLMFVGMIEASARYESDPIEASGVPASSTSASTNPTLIEEPTSTDPASPPESAATDSAPRPTTAMSDVSPSEQSQPVEPKISEVELPPPMINPLTGLAMDNPLLVDRYPVVRVDNDPEARPPYGLNEADVVMETRVADNTRFLALYHGQFPHKVGPVRSCRMTDNHLLALLPRPILVCSGSNPTVGNFLLDADNNRNLVTYVDEHHVGGVGNPAPWFWRDDIRKEPFDLFLNVSMLVESVEQPSGGRNQSPPIQIDTAFDLTQGTLIDFVRIPFRYGPVVGWAWSEPAGPWHRSQDGFDHTDAAGAEISSGSVLILSTRYVDSSVDATSPELDLPPSPDGGGKGALLFAGRYMEVDWRWLSDGTSIELFDADGSLMGMPPGRYWIEFTDEFDAIEVG